MHDPKFENEVQKKLEELSFSPSEAVWTRVERAVNEKRRRRAPLFWLFFLPALGLAGGGMIYFAKSRTAPAVQVVQKGTVATPGVAGADRNGEAAKEVTGANDVTGSDEVTGANPVVPSKASSREVIAVTGVATSKEERSSKEVRYSKEVAAATDKTTDKTSDKTFTNEVTSSVTSTDGEPADDMTSTAAVASSRSWSHARVPALTAFDRSFVAPSASSLSRSSLSTAAKSPIQLKRKYLWEAGFAGGIGLSSLNTTLFQQQPAMANDVMAAGTPTLVNAAASRSKNTGSFVQPDLSYWAGIVAQRPLSTSLTLSLGLNLHYYSAKLHTGSPVYNDLSSFYAASTLLTSQSPRALQSSVYPYYAPGDMEVFINRYYFLELPASILWQVSHSRKLPLFWENGLSLSYLVSTNSLYYNAKSGVFYKDQGSMANKTQLNVATALLVGLPIRNLRIQAGPQVQYGLTSLQHQSSGSQHLFYGGIRLVFLPGKKK